MKCLIGLDVVTSIVFDDVGVFHLREDAALGCQLLSFFVRHPVVGDLFSHEDLIEQFSMSPTRNLGC